MKFVDVKNDVAFRKIFGNENKKEILISFLNAILGFAEGKKIVDVAIKDTYIPALLKELKNSILDVRATDQRGISYIVEMQLEEPKGFDKRVQYYAAKQYAVQIDKGEDYPKLNQVIFIGILNFDMFEGGDYLTRHLFINTSTGNQDLKDIEYSFIELTKFNKQEHELETLTEKWVYFIKNAENLNVIPANTNDKGLEEAYNDANTHQWTKDELWAYDSVFMARQDARGREELKIERAEEKGRVEGKIEGKTERNHEVAINSIKAGLSNDIIKMITGLSDDQINALCAELQ